MIGLDTSAIIDLFRGSRSLINLLEKSKDKVVLNQISYLELMFGIDLRSKSHQVEEGFYDSMFSSYQVLPLSNLACKKAARIFMDLKRRGRTTGQLDCAIAGIFLSHGVGAILTRNKRHFEHIKGLKVITY